MLVIGLLVKDEVNSNGEVSEDEEDIMVVGLQGMSQRPLVTPLSLLLKSNAQVLGTQETFDRQPPPAVNLAGQMVRVALDRF